MNKKIVIGIIVAIVIIVGIIGGVLFYILNNPKYKPEDIWQEYVSCINEQNYETMYEMITEDSKAQISKEDFISRNKNIYEGIDMVDMKVEISGIEEENSKTSKISYNQSMSTEAGEIKFSNTVRLT